MTFGFFATFLVAKLEQLIGHELTGVVPADRFLADLHLDELDSIAAVEIITGLIDANSGGGEVTSPMPPDRAVPPARIKWPATRVGHGSCPNRGRTLSSAMSDCTSMTLLSIILGILGAIGGVTWLIDQFRKRVQARAFFELFHPAEEVVIVVPSLGQSGPNTTMTFEDALACATALEAFVRHGLNYRIKLHTHVTPEDRASNLFVIGGEVVNDIMASLAKLELYPIRAEPTPAGTQLRDRKGHSVHLPLQHGETDCAIVGVLRNPWSGDNAKRIYLAAGAEGIGTWAAAVELTINTRTLRRRLRAHDVSAHSDFEAVLDVTVHGYQVPVSVVTRAIQLA